ncbi:glycosyl transferase [Pseudomonas brassicacearum]|uniref:glycosyltransferase n=1 Tax=Pseudomonas brassicacearum TaxID=930166 RepID=UPI000F46C3FB|nr:glycosyltransferase [Pseudomonas brassicacearum]ROM78201.1 glycosyl transferase [Pseudomonas brassicacearum]
MPVKYPKVAVLLAAYNGMQWIEEQLDSILAQVAVEVTLFISIDPSIDDTEAWCRGYAGSHQGVVVLPDVGKFGGASRNFFRLLRDVDIEGYDFIGFADQDDIWDRNKLQRAVQCLHLKGVDAYSSNVVAFWPNGRTVLLNKAQPQVKWDYLFEAAGPGCTYVMRNRLAMSLKFSMLDHWSELQSVSLHDWYFYAFARSHNYHWYIDPVPSMRYRQHENNQVGANSGLWALMARYKIIRDGWWLGQVRLIAALASRSPEPLPFRDLNFSRIQLIKLSFKAWQCRRRLRDKFLFFSICWITAMTWGGAK